MRVLRAAAGPLVVLILVLVGWYGLAYGLDNNFSPPSGPSTGSVIAAGAAVVVIVGVGAVLPIYLIYKVLMQATAPRPVVMAPKQIAGLRRRSRGRRR